MSEITRDDAGLLAALRDSRIQTSIEG